MLYRGALHLHSSYSYDAKLSLPELRALLVDAGVSFALMTEHTDELTPERARAFINECDALSDAAFVFIPGFEVSFLDMHILMPGSRTFLAQHATTVQLITWKEEAGIAILAHPHRNGYRTAEIPAGVLDGIEIWNAQYDGKIVPRNGARRLFTRERKRSRGLKAFAGWDFHRAAHAGGPVIALDLPALSAGAVLEALKQGAYTLRSSIVEVQSDGTLSGGDPRWVSVMSSLEVALIRTLKAVNRVLAWGGIKLPSGLVASVRRRL